MLFVDGLVASRAIQRLSFEARDGQCVGVWCREPAHATRLAECIGGMRAPLEGRVVIDEADTVRDAQHVRALVSWSRRDAVPSTLTLIEYARAVAAARPLRSLAPAALIERLHLTPSRRLVTPHAQAEAALVAGLLPSSRLIVLDDPFAALTDATRLAAIDFVRALAPSQTTVVIASTIERDVRAVSHRVIATGATP